jgi:hypothetical protein
MQYWKEILLAAFPFIMFYSIVGLAYKKARDIQPKFTGNFQTKKDKMKSLFTILQQ